MVRCHLLRPLPGWSCKLVAPRAVPSQSERKPDAPVIGIRDTSAQDAPMDTSQGPSKKRIGLWLGMLVGIAVVLALAWPRFSNYLSTSASVSAQSLRIAQVQRGEFVRDVAVDGSVVAAVSPTLFAPEDGTVTFLFEAGDTVTSGDLVAVVDSPQLSSRLQQEQATLESLETGLRRKGIEKKAEELRNQQAVDLAGVSVQAAERELRRAEASREHQAISQQDYEKSRDDLSIARLEHEHARQNAGLQSERLQFELETQQLQYQRQRLAVQDLQRQVDELQLRSPVNGMIGQLRVEQKSAVARNAPLMTVVDLSAFEIEVRVPEAYADDLALGLAAEVSFGGQVYPAHLTSVSPEVRERQVLGRVRFAEGAAPEMRQNQRVSTRIVLESKPSTLKLQRGPFMNSGGGRMAYVRSDGLLERRAITIGSTSAREVEVLSGLEVGEYVVISDLSRFDGAEQVLLSE